MLHKLWLKNHTGVNYTVASFTISPSGCSIYKEDTKVEIQQLPHCL